MTTPYVILFTPNQHQEMHERVDEFNSGDVVAIGYPKVYTLYKLTEKIDRANNTSVRSWQSVGTRYHWD